MRADGIEALAGCPALEQIDLGRDPVLTPGNTDTFFDSKVAFTFEPSLACWGLASQSYPSGLWSNDMADEGRDPHNCIPETWVPR